MYVEGIALCGVGGVACDDGSYGAGLPAHVEHVGGRGSEVVAETSGGPEMNRFIALVMLLAITAIISTGCPRLRPVERTLADIPVETAAK